MSIERDFDTLRTARKGTIAWLHLNRPDALNSVSPQMVRDIGAALDDIEADRSIRCLVVTGTGRAFCAGADLKAVKEFGERQRQEDAARDFAVAANALLARIELLPLPVIAAVNGVALAGGLELVLVCDLVVAVETAKLGDAHAKYGLLPGWGASARLPRKIGPNRAKQLMFTAEHVSAATMQHWGLVNQVVPAEQLEEATQALAESIAQKSPLGLRRTKRLVDDGLEQPLHVALRAERAAVEAHSTSHDRREGLAAFAAKRPAEFNGT